MKKKLLFITLLFTGFLSFSQVTTQEREALIALYNSTGGANWTDKTNWIDTSKPVSTWFGVTVENDHVTKIELNSNNLVGIIPAELGSLSELKSFSAYFNKITQVANGIKNAGKLEVLNVMGNEISGSFTTQFSEITSLKSLQIYHNKLSGSLPTSIKNLINLTNLDISYNDFKGEIPDLSTLTVLNDVWLVENYYTFSDLEPLINSFSSFHYDPQKNLESKEDLELAIGESYTFNANVAGSQNNYFWQRDNGDGTITVVSTDENFTITINSEDDYKNYRLVVESEIVTGLTLSTPYFKISQRKNEDHPDFNALVAFYNATNGGNWTNNTNWLDATKPISTWFGIAMENDRVIELELINNNLTGAIPLEIENLNALQKLNLGGNSISGTIPTTIGNITTLVQLGLELNQLSGEIPKEIGNLLNLEEIVFWDNNLTGSIPPEIGNCVNLKILSFEENKLTGNIPTTFSNLTKMESFWLNDNQLSGNLSAFFSDFKKLTYFSLYNNNFDGIIPTEVLNLTELNYLNIKNNKFEGEIPNLSSLTKLKRVYFENNYFDFTDLKSLVETNSFDTFNYSPQNTKDSAIGTTIGAGETITITVDDQEVNRSSQKNANGNEFKWFKNNTTIPNEITNTLVLTNVTVNDNGVYYCEITNPNLPNLIIKRATVTVTVDATASIDNENLLLNVSVFPNPVNNKFVIKIKEIENAQIIIYDVNGKKLLNKKIKTNEEEINISKFNNGVYILSITSNNKKLTKRLIKI